MGRPDIDPTIPLAAGKCLEYRVSRGLCLSLNRLARCHSTSHSSLACLPSLFGGNDCPRRRCTSTAQQFCPIVTALERANMAFTHNTPLVAALCILVSLLSSAVAQTPSNDSFPPDAHYYLLETNSDGMSNNFVLYPLTEPARLGAVCPPSWVLSLQ